MFEFIVIVESSADARTATKLAERILVEKVDWLEDDNLQYFFQWSGLQNGTQHSCWSDVKKIIDDAKEQLKYKLEDDRLFGLEKESVIAVGIFQRVAITFAPFWIHTLLLLSRVLGLLPARCRYAS